MFDNWFFILPWFRVDLIAMLCYASYIIFYQESRKKVAHFHFLINFAIQEVMKIMIGFRVAKEYKKFLQKLAEEENRTLSSFLNNAVLTYIKDHKGITWKKPKE